MKLRPANVLRDGRQLYFFYSGKRKRKDGTRPLNCVLQIVPFNVARGYSYRQTEKYAVAQCRAKGSHGYVVLTPGIQSVLGIKESDIISSSRLYTGPVPLERYSAYRDRNIHLHAGSRSIEIQAPDTHTGGKFAPFK